MQKLNLIEMKEVEGGALSGSFLSGIGNIIDSFSGLISDIVGAAMGFKVMNESIKGSIKYGGNTFTWDNSELYEHTITMPKAGTKIVENDSEADYEFDNFDYIPDTLNFG